ncbi:MAG: hypothetical protein GX454_08840 [Brooklawnia sp.]|nr:hypothetical protein [Brooklawnia sp.]
MELAKVAYSVSGSIAHVTLNNPGQLNAVDLAMATELERALATATADPGVRVVLLSGAGKAFCAGGDVAWFAEQLESGEFDVATLVRTLGRVAVLIRTMPKPVVASVHRSAAGAGMGLAMLADFCVASDDASFVTAFSRVGLASDTGVGYLLTRRLGHLRAAELLMGGRALSAPDAYRLGLITAVVPADELSQATVDLIGSLLAGPRVALAAIKQQIWQAQFAGFDRYLEQEVELQAACIADPDFAEGLAAFAERRPPCFS